MARLTVSPQAEHDAAQIIELLTREAGADVGSRYRQEFDDLLARFARFPKSGAPRVNLGRHIRIGVVTPYVVIYELEPDHVMVLRIVDGRRKITRRLIRQ
ncbi:MAG TPA: type II toxin-antitoxin system RelE/ParE family toxin [Reyranella sp.]|jgi:toxin ParE1/3/4